MRSRPRGSSSNTSLPTDGRSRSRATRAGWAPPVARRPYEGWSRAARAMRAPAERRLAAVLLAPALAVLASVTLYPLAQALVLSLERRVPVFGIDEFVGLRHYAFLLRDPAFANPLGVTAVFTVASVALEVVLGVAAALALATMRRWRAVGVGLLLLPWCVPGVVTARLFEWLYEPTGWLGIPGRALPALIVAEVWRTTPFLALFGSARLISTAPAVYASPVAWQLLTSITPSEELQQGARLWPSHPTLASYAVVFTQSPLPRALVNSIGIALTTTLLGTVLGTLGAYALARLAVPGRRALVLGILMTTALPAIATVGPLYLTMRALGLRDTWGAVIIAHTSIALPLMLWLMARFLRALPRELEDAAFVDGAGRLQALRHVVVPAAAPGIASAAVVTFLLSWNEFLFAYTFTATEASRTAPVALALFPGVFEIPWADVAAASVLTSAPPLLVVVLLQRALVRGLLAGGVRE